MDIPRDATINSFMTGLNKINTGKGIEEYVAVPEESIPAKFCSILTDIEISVVCRGDVLSSDQLPILLYRAIHDDIARRKSYSGNIELMAKLIITYLMKCHMDNPINPIKTRDLVLGSGVYRQAITPCGAKVMMINKQISNEYKDNFDLRQLITKGGVSIARVSVKGNLNVGPTDYESAMTIFTKSPLSAMSGIINVDVAESSKHKESGKPGVVGQVAGKAAALIKQTK